jgi:hypothetical protein
MKPHLRKITITLEQDLARWVRVEAARNDTSISRYLANILKERMKQNDKYNAAKRRALAHKPFLKSNGQYLTREKAHDREHLR